MTKEPTTLAPLTVKIKVLQREGFFTSLQQNRICHLILVRFLKYFRFFGLFQGS